VGNDYGHPSQAAMDRLGRVGAHLFRTDVDGEVLAVSDGQTVTVTSENPQPGFTRGVKATGTTSATVATGPILPGERKLSKSSREDKHRYGHGQGQGAEPASGSEAPVPVDQLGGGEHAAQAESAPAERRAQPAREAHGGGEAAPASTGTYVASKRSRKFHKADCKGAADIKAENKVFFSSRAEAAEGREPAGDCKP
jgi:hypothetical protein